MKFYDVIKRAQVNVPDKECVKTKFKRKDGKGFTYAVRAVVKGHKLTAFVSAEAFGKLKLPEV